MCGDSSKTRGIVDYITEYTTNRVAPDVSGFVSECPRDFGDTAGSLWLMPAGKRDDAYGNRLQTIDWQRLYGEQDGFIMLEDLKQQWRDIIAPDYVLIDSRTGHTDVSGICTRQLPDAVVAMFFPNEQNLVGLKEIVSYISKESEKTNNENIFIHYVVSNVPDLDDEDNILQNRLAGFRSAFGCEDFFTIHHYDSLHLLDQVVFTLKRPRSRLAQEYKRLADLIVRQNIEDRKGVIEYLKDSAKPDVDKIRLNKIKSYHSADGEIFFYLASISEKQGDFREAHELLSSAIEKGYRIAKTFLMRSMMNNWLENQVDETNDLKTVVELDQVDYTDLVMAIVRLRDLDPDYIEHAADFASVRALEGPEQQALATFFMSTRHTLHVAETIFKRWISDETDPTSYVYTELMLCLIGLGRFGEAMELMGERNTAKETRSIPLAFNYLSPLPRDRQLGVRKRTASTSRLGSGKETDRRIQRHDI